MKPTRPAVLLAAAALGGCASVGAANLQPASAPAAAAPTGSPAPTLAYANLPISYQKAVLANGLTLLVHTDHKAPLVAMHTVYRVGSKDEVPGKTGFAHLFEHLMFNGSAHHDDEFFRPLEAAGASLINGTTNGDRTNFYQTVPKEALDLALFLESDRMGHLLPAVTKAKLDEQRGVVKNEKRQREGQPYGKVHQLLTEASFPAGHPYSWTTIGSMQDLDAATLDDVHAWFRRYYGPNNAVLVLSGDIGFEDAKAKVERAFGSIAPSPALDRNTSWQVPMTASKRLLAHDKVTQTRIYRAWNLPPRGEPDTLLLALAADILAGDKASALYQRLITKESLATAVAADVNEGMLASQFQLMVTLKQGVDAAAVERVLDEEIAKLARTPPSPALLQRLKTSLYVSRIEGRESLAAKAAELAACEALLGGQDACDQQWTTLQSAQGEQISTAARQWLLGPNLTLEVRPEPALAAGTTADLPRKSLPTVGDPAGIVLPTLQRFTLSNGLPVLLAERRDVPLVRMSLFWPYGTSAQPQAGNFEMLLGMLSEGADGLSAEQLTEAYGNLGAQFGTDLDADALAVQLASPSANLRAAVELFTRNLLKPSFPADALERRKARKIAGLQASTKSPGGVLGLNQYRLMYGEHPYGRFNSLPLLAAATESLTPKVLQDLHPQVIRPEGAQLLVVGDTSVQALKDILEAQLGRWQPAAGVAAIAASMPPVVAPPARVFLFDLPGAPQTLVAAAAIGVAMSEPQREAMELANTVLGGLFTSRLNSNLREQKGWSYGASSGLGEARGPGLFYAQAQVETQRTAESIVEMQREVAELGDKRPPTAAELEQARKSLVRALPAEAETASGVLNLYQRQLVYALPEDSYSGYPARLAALDGKAAAAAAKQLANPQALTWFIAGDLQQIEASVRALKLGPVQVLGADGSLLR